jgi:RHS repeat-associated protein
VSAARSLVAVLVGLAGMVVSPSKAVAHHAVSGSRRWSLWGDPRYRALALKPMPTLTSQSDDFPSGSSITAVNGISKLALDPANAYDNNYAVKYSVSVTINGSSQTYGSATLVVAVETNDGSGSGWIERGTYSYNCGYLSGPPPWPTRTCSQWTAEQANIAAAGLGLGDSLRLKAKSFSTSNGAGGSFVIRGGDAGGPNPGTYNGVTYTTDIVFTTFAQWDDFPTGNSIAAVGFTTGANLYPGGAIDNVYTVHYFATVTLNSHPSTYGTATLVVAVETNDGTGSGWIERTTVSHLCSYLSGPPPYPQKVCNDWPHQQAGITVAGLGVNDSVRLKAKSFTTSNGAGGSFVIRGGDGGGVNPETFNGVTYNTKVFRGVAVRPELPERQGFASSAGSQRFFVKNRAETEANLSADFSCTGLSNCSVTPTAFTGVLSGESRIVTLNYTLGAAGTSGTGMVKVFDSFDNNLLRDSASITTKAVGAPAPVVSIADVNPGTAIARNECLTVPAGSAAAFECGDLRIMQPLPGIRTLNETRVPALLYNSAMADPYPIVAAIVTLAAGSPIPDSVEGVLTVGGVEKARARWAGSDWTAGSTRRIALGYSAAADTTKVYDYTFEVATIYLPSGRNATSVSGKLIVVNRRGGGFGAGWWLAGMERLENLADGNKLWIGGDGSARLYSAAGTNRWVAARLHRPDTLTWDGSTYYVRKLPGGVQLKFNSSGQHVLTINRLGHQVSFAYGSGGLSTITMPSQGGGQVYTFGYGGDGQLSSVTAPGGRITLVFVSALRLDSIRDPDNRFVRFTYENPSSRRVATRTDRRGAVSSFSYDAAAKLWRSHLNLLTDSIRIGFRARDVVGLAGATPKTATDTANVYTSVFGARQFTAGPNYIAQETKFWLDRLGAPRRSMNALSQETRVKREDGEWESLGTELQATNGFLTRARYDLRGNLLASIDVNPLGTGQDATTRYHWNTTWDRADSLVTPTGLVTTVQYSGVNGNREWQQAGSDPARRIYFRYGNGLGLLSSTVLPGTPPDSIEYGAMGNVAVARTAKGYDTRYTSDQIGRDTMVQARLDTLSAVYLTTIVRFDVFDRDTLKISAGPALGGASAESIYVRKVYNPTGQVDTIVRWSRPDPAAIGNLRMSWVYDLASRAVLETASDSRQERWTYDPAGNVTADSSRRGNTITMTYDALDRVATRVLPAVSYASRNSNITSPPQAPYPAYQIPVETQTFTYNTLGEMETANNPFARISRSYFPNGLLNADTLRIQAVDTTNTNWDLHKYVVRHTYDLDGRQTVLSIPSQLASGVWQDVTYTYEPQVGAIQSVVDVQHNTYTFGYTNRNEVASITYPAQYQETFRYDSDGRLASDTLRNQGSIAFPRLTSSLVRAATFRYDAADRALLGADPSGYLDTLTFGYSGLGHLVTSKFVRRPLGGGSRSATGERFTYDPLANRISTEFGDTTPSSTYYEIYSSYYQAATGRIVTDWKGMGPTAFSYDLAGNTEFISKTAGTKQERASFYAADERLRAADWRWVNGVSAKYAFEEYRYDALGRRVFVWSKKSCDEAGMVWWEVAECKQSLVRRTVWDDDRELAEIQMPGGTAANEVALYENETGLAHLPNLSTQVGSVDRNQYFGVVIYTAGRGVDQPLAVTRLNYEDQHDDFGSPVPWNFWSPITTIPFWNRNGDALVGVFSTGAQAICNPPTSPPPSDCVRVMWGPYWSAFDRNLIGIRDNWHGTILEGKRDEVQLAYNRSRYYDPQTGRFETEDPRGLEGGLNLYGFAGGDPINLTDPSGQFPFLIVLFAGVFTAEVLTGHDVVHAFFTAAAVVASTALGSALAAGIEWAAPGGRAFAAAFAFNFDMSAGFLLLNIAYAGAYKLATGENIYLGAGANGLFQGYVHLKKAPGFCPGICGLTWGSAAVFVTPDKIDANLFHHEFGHTVQFFGLSGFGGLINPWWPYGVMGVLGSPIVPSNPVGRWWENLATQLGDLVR